ncbi:formyltransferase family protein [Streptomyces sp. NPDC057694]|uniref:formyltransferase family protein n=1 Tax=Streptomyces sp. NPDC057694 TaxID=3346216 RepID=UPI00369ACCEC
MYPTEQPFSLPSCDSPESLRFVYLNLKDHPRGTLMLQQLLAAGFRPAMVVEEDSGLAEAGRASQLAELSQLTGFMAPPATREVCEEHCIRYELVPDHNGSAAKEALQEATVDLVVLGDTRILKPYIIDSVPYGIVNVHPGFLPDVRGNNPYIWAVIHGLPQGATVHLIDSRVDRGPVMHVEKYELPRGTTLPRLILDLNELCGKVLVEALRRLTRGTATLTEQPDDRRLTFREASPEIRALATKMLHSR